MRCQKLILLLCLNFSFCAFVLSHELPKIGHDHYSFKVLKEAVNDDSSLMSDDVERLLSKLHFWNCSDSGEMKDYRKCLTSSELYSFAGSDRSKQLNSTDFAELSPAIVYCLLPAPERNAGRCTLSPKNHSELFNSFAKNFSQHGEQGITPEALDGILEAINKTIGQYLNKTKCFSAESIIEEVEEQEEGHNHEEDHHDGEKKVLDQEDFQKACASIVLHLVQGFCIEEGHGHNETKSSLPPKEFFIKDLFKTKKHLSEEDLEAIMEGLGIGKHSDSSQKVDNHGHRRRRSSGAVLIPQWESGASHVVHRRAADSHGHQINGQSSSCYSLDDMLTVFGIDHSVGADAFDFKELCPAFIQQSKSGACKESNQTKKAEPEKHYGKIWGYGFIAVTIISITSLVGVATIPFLGKKMYKKILAMLVALAVGTLAGDSLLHLLPHALGLHAHKEGESHEEDNDFIWKALVVLASVYAFFLFETLMHLGLKSKLGDHGHSHVDIELPGPSSRHMSFKKKRSCSKLEHHEGAPPLEDSLDEKPPILLENGDIVLTNVEGANGNYNASPSCTFHSHCVYEHVSSTDTEAGEYENTRSEFGDDHSVVQPHDPATKPKKTLKESLSRRSVFSEEEGTKRPLKKINAVAWMIIIGDTLHNISDGLAIGAAFSEGGSSGISGGISTSIAVFCHELPHELGDFAVLLSAGMSVKMALFANVMSAMSCYIGLVIGILIGQHADVRFWIFAIAAGMFLYVALVDMLPDLMHSETLQTDPVVTFLCQNFGLLLGMSIMLVIALFEEDLMAVTW